MGNYLHMRSAITILLNFMRLIIEGPLSVNNRSYGWRRGFFPFQELLISQNLDVRLSRGWKYQANEIVNESSSKET